MALSVGTRLGVYEVNGVLGAGGMGEVYRARDTRLNRDVALKVLPDAFAADPDRLARFEREAQLLAALNHPHIAAIYGFEDSGAHRALVLELVEGPTLADRIARGPMPLDEALAIARQVADALEAAHEKGIIHRDLKPANIKLSPAGTVKVLDFGLGKLNDPDASSAPGDRTALTMSPTVLSPAMTTFGVILGTAAYMSPEQARGRGIDRRADIWSFGCVLYEMLTGRAVFAGDSVSEIVSEVLKTEPDWSSLPPGVPPHVRRVLRRCLEKNLARRFRDIGDAAIDLDEAVSASPPATSSRRTRLFAAALGVAVIGVVAAWMLGTRQGPAPAAGLRQFHIAAPANADAVSSVALSPDGRELALTGAVGDRGGIWIRPLASVDARNVGSPTGRPQHPFWSPDGRSLGFFEGGQLKVLTLATGQTRTVAAAPGGFGGTWGADDTIVFAPTASGGLFRVSARGGNAMPLTRPDPANAESHRWPQFLPDGRRFIFMGWSSRDTASNDRFTIQTASLDAPGPTVVTTSASAAIYDAAGFLVFALNVPPRLLAVPFDGTRIVGEPVTLAEDFSYDWVSGRLPATSAADGTLVYLNDRDEYVQPTWFDRSGAVVGTLGDRGMYFDPAFTRDGASLILEKSDPDIRSGDVWSIDPSTGAATRLTDDPTFENAALWRPDGREIVYSSDRDGLSSVFLMRASGGERHKLFGRAGMMAYASGWSSDGAHLLVTTFDEARSRDVWLVPTDANATPQPVLDSRYEEDGAVFSPDGRWIAYASNESGNFEVYVRSWPALAEVTRISTGGGRQPQWRGDGRELFYVARGAIMSAAVTPGTPLRIGTPQTLFSTRMNVLQGLRNSYAATPDGRRFLVLSPLVDRRSSPVTVILNWTTLAR